MTFTVPVNVCPPTTLAGRTTLATVTTGAGLSVSQPGTVNPLNEAEIGTTVDAVTDAVVILNWKLVCPCASETVAGSDASAGLLLARVTSAPPACAGNGQASAYPWWEIHLQPDSQSPWKC